MLDRITPPCGLWIDYFPITRPSNVLYPSYFCPPLSSRCQNVWMQRLSWRTPTWWWQEPTNWPSLLATVRRSKTTDPGLFLITVVINNTFSDSLTPTCFISIWSHFLYPNKYWKTGDAAGDHAAAPGTGDGKYELLTVADDVIAEEIRNLIARSELHVYFDWNSLLTHHAYWLYYNWTGLT